VIYLIPAKLDFQTECAIDHLERELAGEFSIERLTVGSSITAALKLWNYPPSRPVHAWGDAALIAAAFRGFRRIFYSPPSEIPADFGFPLRMALWQWSVHVVCPTEAARQHFLAKGTRQDRCAVIPPGVDTDRVATARDTKLHRAMGFKETDFVTLLSGESTSAAAHRIGAWAVSILHVIDPRHRLLVWGRGSQTDALVRFGKRLDQPELVTVAERSLGRAVEWEELVGAADALLVPSDGFVATLPASIAVAAGLPIVASASASNQEILDGARNAQLVPQATPKTLAEALLKISQGKFTRQRPVEVASSHSYSERWRELYRELIPDQNRLSSSRY
jgi:glycosyltransferase involved in cell wall biosynthesis